MSNARQTEHWLGSGKSRHKETVTIAKLDGKTILVMRETDPGGWIFPSVHTDGIQETLGLPESTTVFNYHSFHPYFRYGFGIIICTVFMTLSLFLSFWLIRSWQINL